MTKSRLNKSWENPRGAKAPYSPEGIKELRVSVKYGLMRKYIGIAEQLFQYDMPDEATTDMNVMSQDTVPEVYLMKNGKCVWFRIGEQVHCLPVVYNSSLNIYGKPSSWSPMINGYIAGISPKNEVFEDIINRQLDATNSVIMLNDMFGESDYEFIDRMTTQLTEVTLTTTQLALMARCPFVFRVTPDTRLAAQNYYLSLAECAPAVFVNREGEPIEPVTEEVAHQIDPTLFEIFDRFETMILEQIGYNVIPITKRAQQSVAEVTVQDSKIEARRQEKFRMREKAVDRINKMFGLNITVKCMVDSRDDNNDRADEDDKDVQ